jgi:hypothetical protein
METLLASLLLAFAAYHLKSRSERRRIRLLGEHLADHQIEKLMQTLTEGYARALGETDAARRESIWQLLGGTEYKLCAQARQLAEGFAKVNEAQARMNRLPWPLSEAASLISGSSFDLRAALKIHAAGLARAAQPAPAEEDGLRKARAFTLSAEMLLLQHSCHWFCKSKSVASARVLVRHQTPYAQVLASVSPETRRAYLDLLGGL